MNQKCRLIKANEKWKFKAKERSIDNCELRKKIKRLEEQVIIEKLNHDVAIELLKDEIKKTLILSSTDNEAGIATKQKLRVLCVRLLTVGVVSFRAVPRILKIIGDSIKYINHVPPHFTSVINWALRAGIGVFKNVSPVCEPWIAIIDMSNTIGTRKILVVKRVLLSCLSKKGKAIALEDSECIGIDSRDVWNGNTVKEALDKFFLNAGMPAAILKDAGSDLKKGVRLFCEQNQSKNIIVIDDIGHVAALILKNEFEKNPDFVKFIELVTTGSKKIRQTIVAWAMSPRLRDKGRFQGITKLANWAKDILAILDGNDSGISPDEMAIIKKTFSGLAELRLFIDRFVTTCELVEQLLALMKNKGLNKKTAKEGINILSKLPKDSQVKQRLLSWISKHLQSQQQLRRDCRTLLVSSDTIESLFGKFKSIIERSPKPELNKLIYIIPLLCGKINDEKISHALLKCSHVEMLEFISKNIPITIRQQRFKLLKKSKKLVPNLRNFTTEKTA